MVILINGYPNSGKDTFVSMVKAIYPKTINFHTSDPVKQALTDLGWKEDWNGDKTDKARNLIAHIMKEGNELFNLLEVSVDAVVSKSKVDTMVFIHVREPHNLKLLKEKYNALTVLVRRPEAEQEYTNDSDRNVDDFEYDYIIENLGKLPLLEASAYLFVTEMQLGACSKCINYKEIPECMKSNVVFGIGLGYDNVVYCDRYSPKDKEE